VRQEGHVQLLLVADEGRGRRVSSSHGIRLLLLLLLLLNLLRLR
jgi:hypothetical protein